MQTFPFSATCYSWIVSVHLVEQHHSAAVYSHLTSALVHHVTILRNYISHNPLVQNACSHVDENRSGHPPHCTKKKVRGKMHEEEDGSDANSCTAPRIVASRSVDVADVEGSKDHPSKLCGYLNKLSGKGPLRGYKPRWFVYDPRKCYLYCFKSPQDALPLGHIEIGDACFSYDMEGEEGQFEIRTDGKEFLLKVLTFVCIP